MKRIIAALLIAIIAFAFIAAGAENYYDYRIHDQYFAPMYPVLFGDKNALYNAWGDREGNEAMESHLLWLQDGNLLRDYTYSTENARFNQAVFLPREDNTCGVLAPGKKDTDRGDEKFISIELYEWTENGLELQKEIPGNWERTEIKTLQNGFTVYDYVNGILCCYDIYGNQLREIQMTEEIPATEILGTMRYGNMTDADGNINDMFVITFRTEIRDYNHARFAQICIDQQGVKWRRDFTYFSSVAFPGDGYFYRVESTNDGKTSPKKITRLDEGGNDALSKVLSADNLVLGFNMSVSPKTGNLILHGKAVANSRKIYTVFCMELDENMNQKALDVRRIDYYDDYNPSVQMQKDGSLLVNCTGSEVGEATNVPTVLIPFDVLPVAEMHGLQLK